MRHEQSWLEPGEVYTAREQRLSQCLLFIQSQTLAQETVQSLVRADLLS